MKKSAMIVTVESWKNATNKTVAEEVKRTRSNSGLNCIELSNSPILALNHPFSFTLRTETKIHDIMYVIEPDDYSEEIKSEIKCITKNPKRVTDVWIHATITNMITNTPYTIKSHGMLFFDFKTKKPKLHIKRNIKLNHPGGDANMFLTHESAKMWLSIMHEDDATL